MIVCVCVCVLVLVTIIGILEISVYNLESLLKKTNLVKQFWSIDNNMVNKEEQITQVYINLIIFPFISEDIAKKK